MVFLHIISTCRAHPWCVFWFDVVISVKKKHVKKRRRKKTNCQLLLLFGTKGMFTSFAGVPACLRVCARRSCASVCVSALYGKVDLVRGVAAVRVFVLAGVPRLSCVWTSVFICGVTRLRGACWCASFHVLSRIEGLLSDHGTPRQEKGVCAWYS